MIVFIEKITAMIIIIISLHKKKIIIITIIIFFNFGKARETFPFQSVSMFFIAGC